MLIWFVENNSGSYNMFTHACQNKNIQLLQYLYNNNRYENEYINEYFAYACGNNNLDHAKWLLQKFPEIDPNFNNQAITAAFRSGEKEVAEWLLQTIKINISEIVPILHLMLEVRSVDYLSCELICRYDVTNYPYLLYTSYDTDYGYPVALVRALKNLYCNIDLEKLLNQYICDQFPLEVMQQAPDNHCVHNNYCTETCDHIHNCFSYCTHTENCKGDIDPDLGHRFCKCLGHKSSRLRIHQDSCLESCQHTSECVANCGHYSKFTILRNYINQTSNTMDPLFYEKLGVKIYGHAQPYYISNKPIELNYYYKTSYNGWYIATDNYNDEDNEKIIPDLQSKLVVYS